MALSTLATRRRLIAGAVFAPVIAALACALLLGIPAEMSPDGWFALVSGREIVAHGLPSHDSLTVWGYGRRWVDQQWLAQLAYYGLYSVGGLRLALLVNVGIVVSAFAGAVALGRARGGSLQNVVLVSIPAAFVIGRDASALRPQSLVLPLFVVLIWLLSSDARRASRRVFLVVPLLVLWASLHGSIVLGSLLVAIHVATGAWQRRRIDTRGVALLAVAVALPFASPYGLHLTGYFRAILFNSQLAQYLPDWMPTTPAAATLPFYALAIASIYLLGRSRTTLTPFEQVALVVLLVLGVEANRGTPWFALFALATLPTMLNPVLRRELRPPSNRTGLALAGASAVAVLAVLVLAASKPASWFTRDYPAKAGRVAAAAAAGGSKLFANGAYADWLLFVQPILRGRVAYDARFELLPNGRLAHAAAVSIGRSDAKQILAPFDVVVLRPEETEMRDVLVRDPHWRRVPAGSRVVVFRRIAKTESAG